MDTWATSSLTPQIVGRLGRRPRPVRRACSRWTCGRRPTRSSARGCSTRVVRSALSSSTRCRGPTPRSPASSSTPTARSCRSRRATRPTTRTTLHRRVRLRRRAVLGRRAAGPGMDVAFDRNQMKVGRRLAIKLLNAVEVRARPSASRAATPRGPTEPLDRAMLAQLADVVDEATAAFEALRLHPRARAHRGVLLVVLRRLRRAGEGARLRRQGDGRGVGPAPRCGTALSTLLDCSRRSCRSSPKRSWSWWQEGSIHRAAVARRGRRRRRGRRGRPAVARR